MDALRGAQRQPAPLHNTSNTPVLRPSAAALTSSLLLPPHSTQLPAQSLESVLGTDSTDTSALTIKMLAVPQQVRSRRSRVRLLSAS